MAITEDLIKRLGKLQSTLLTSGLQQTNQPLYQVISQLIKAVIDSNVGVIQSSVGGGGSGTGSGTGGNQIIIQQLSPITFDGEDGLDGFPGLRGLDGTSGHSITIYEQDTEPLAAVPGDFWFVTVP